MKKSILRNTLSLALCAALMLTLLPVTALAASGTISADGTYYLSYYGNNSVITINTAEAVTLVGAPDVTYTNMQINCIAAGVSLTLSNVNIDNSGGCALAFTGAGNTLALDGSSTLTSGGTAPGVRVANGTELTISDGAGAGTGQLTATGGSGGAGIGGCCGSGGTLTITGGTVTAIGGNGGAGIGGGDVGGEGGSVAISGGTVTATGGFYGAGIGGGGGYMATGGTGAAVNISGGTVTAAAGGVPDGTNGYAIGGGGFHISGSVGAPGTCVITGGTVKVETGDMGPVPTNDSAAQVYLTTVTLNGAGIAAVSALTTNAGYTYGINDMKTDASGKLYLYLPESTNTTAAQTAATHYGKSTITTSSSSTPASGTLWPPAFSVTGGTANYTYGDDGVLTFTQNGTYTVAMAGGLTQTTTDRIVVASGVTASITLDNVSIVLDRTSGGCAFDMAGATVNLYLESTNTLRSGNTNAGLLCPSGAELVIDGQGSLSATGGQDPSNPSGAGIGGSLDQSGGNITIESGSVTAVGGFLSAGIGSGSTDNTGTITINGGSVTAYGGVYTEGSPDTGSGAGIGGGSNGNGGRVIISGGTVIAYGGETGAGIGGGCFSSGGTVTISGGTIMAIGGTYISGHYGGAGIGAGGSVSGGGVGGTLYISGGSVKTTDGSGLSGTPAVPVISSTVNTPVYLTTVTLDGVGIAAVSALTTNADYAYGIKDMKTDASGKLYLYLPESTNTTAAWTAFVRYAGSVATTTVSTTSLGTLSPDTEAPEVSAVYPNSTGAAVSGNLTITFSEKMRTSAGTVSLDGGATNLAAGSWNADKTVYTASYPGLAYSTSYIVTISGFQDYSGNVMAGDSTHTFTTVPSSDAALSGLNISEGTLSPAFDASTYSYTVSVANSVSSLTITPVTNDANAIVTVNGTAVTSGAASSDIPISVGANSVTVAVTAQDGATTRTYTITVTRANADGGGDSEVNYYTITSTAGTGGSISPSGSASVAYRNDKTYTITADEGYEIDDVLVDGMSVGAVSSYTFENVKKAHTITASFKKTELVNPFTDVTENDWFYNNVLYAYENGLMTGTASDAFSPNGTMTRAMAVTVLYRLSGDTGSHTNNFADVASGAWYEPAVAWAAANGIAGGVGDGSFAPDLNVTREQLAVMMYRYAQYMSYDVSVGEDTNILSYNDALDISDYAYSALQWACGSGIIGGDGSGNLNPQSSATRAEVAAILERFIENVMS